MPESRVCRTWETGELPGKAPLERRIVVPFPVEAPLSGRHSFGFICHMVSSMQGPRHLQKCLAVSGHMTYT